MKTERRWLKSAINAASADDFSMPWAMKSGENKPMPPTPAVIMRILPAPQTRYYAIAAR